MSGSLIHAHDHKVSDYNAKTEKTETVINENQSVATLSYMILTKAEPKKGWCNFSETVAKNIRYPEYLKDLGIEGTVNVQFVVTADGNIDKIRTVYNGSLEANERHINSLKEEAKRAVVSSFGEWRPSTLDGEPVVSSQYDVPVTFRVNYLTNR